MTQKLYVSEDYLARRQTLAVTWRPPAEGSKPRTLEQAIAEDADDRLAKFQEFYLGKPFTGMGDVT